MSDDPNAPGPSGEGPRDPLTGGTPAGGDGGRAPFEGSGAARAETGEGRRSWAQQVYSQPLREWFPTALVGVVVAFFATVILLGPLGIWVESEQVQLGHRGTGMVQIWDEEAYQTALTDTAEVPPDEAPYEVLPGEALAGDVYENVQVLGHLSEGNFLRVMTAITNWVSPEQGCAYCHGPEGNFANDNLYTKVVARRMIQMTQAINSQWSNHVGGQGALVEAGVVQASADYQPQQGAGVNCYTCHRGYNVPSYIWFEEPVDEAGEGTPLLGWRNDQNRGDPRVAYSDLPVTFFERFFLEDNQARVISREIRDDQTGKTIKDTEWTFAAMIHMSKSLGVNCTYCHNTRSMSRWEQSPPQRVSAWYGIQMVKDLNQHYLAPLAPVYPDFRLGPTGDAPKASCSTCHQGVYKPLFGRDMISSWPELAAPAPAAPDETAMLD